jgi:hypothetical protein
MKPPEVQPINDDPLNDLFAAARTPDEADLGAAERFLSRNPEFRAPVSPARLRVRYWPAVLALAAAISGVLVLRPLTASELPGAELPSSAAYDAYSSALGSDW